MQSLRLSDWFGGLFVLAVIAVGLFLLLRGSEEEAPAGQSSATSTAAPGPSEPQPSAEDVEAEARLEEVRKEIRQCAADYLAARYTVNYGSDTEESRIARVSPTATPEHLASIDLRIGSTMGEEIAISNQESVIATVDPDAIQGGHVEENQAEELNVPVVITTQNADGEVIEEPRTRIQVVSCVKSGDQWLVSLEEP